MDHVYGITRMSDPPDKMLLVFGQLGEQPSLWLQTSYLIWTAVLLPICPAGLAIGRSLMKPLHYYFPSANIFVAYTIKRSIFSHFPLFWLKPIPSLQL